MKRNRDKELSDLKRSQKSARMKIYLKLRSSTSAIAAKFNSCRSGSFDKRARASPVASLNEVMLKSSDLSRGKICGKFGMDCNAGQSCNTKVFNELRTNRVSQVR
jgi:hypothetical protein